jgi:hypothetical protein
MNNKYPAGTLIHIPQSVTLMSIPTTFADWHLIQQTFIPGAVITTKAPRIGLILPTDSRLIKNSHVEVLYDSERWMIHTDNIYPIRER